MSDAGAAGRVRRLVGPARILAGLAQVLCIIAAVAAIAFWLELVVAVDVGGVSAVTVVAAAIGLVVLLVPAWWLRHARDTFRDLVVLPQRLETLSAGRPRFTIDSREDLRKLRTGGFVDAARTVRTTVGEVAEFLGPASSVVEVAAPPFWVWTATAAVATLVLVVLALTVGPLVLFLR